jgi:hypothetical protein
MKDIINYNNKGQLHGHYKRYDNIITIRTTMKNHRIIGYEEYHRYQITRYYIR